MTVSRLFSLPLLALAPLMLAACGGEASSDGAAAAGEPLPAIAAPAGTKWADTVTVTPEGGYMIGNPDAPLKLVEYASHTCGACAGYGQAVLGATRVIATTARNFKGRMGSASAEIYMGSPATVAASAIAGVITDPRTVQKVKEPA